MMRLEIWSADGRRLLRQELELDVELFEKKQTKDRRKRPQQPES
jgi:hypothetical protein